MRETVLIRNDPMPLQRTAGIALFACVLAHPASADGMATITTTVTLDQCQQGGNVEDGARWTCPGFSGTSVLIIQRDPRYAIAFGDKAAEQRAAEQTLGAINSPFKADSQQTSILWRVAEVNGKPTPVAAIIRYFTEAGFPGKDHQEGEVLVVSKIGPLNGTDACQVAYVDALANPGAMALAELAADNAAAFDCSKDPVVIGKTGVSPAEYKGGEE